MSFKRSTGAVLIGVAMGVHQDYNERVTRDGDVMGQKIATAAGGFLLVGTPLLAGLRDGAVVEVAEGAFDGLAAIIARLVTTVALAPPGAALAASRLPLIH